RVFKIDRADPFAAGLHHVLGAVHDLHIAVGIHGGDIAGAEPAVLGPAILLLGRFVVARGDPRPADLDLSRALAVPWDFRPVAHQADLDKGRRHTLLGARLVLPLLRPVAHVRQETARDA